MNYLLILASFGLGWLIADLAWIEGQEIQGKISHNLLKFSWPISKVAFIFYSASALIVGLISSYFLTCDTPIFFNTVFWLASLGLIYLALVDILAFQIPFYPALICLIFLIIFNLAQLNINNLLAGGIGAALFYLLIKFTKGKGMGEGDLLVFSIMGLVLGIERLIIAFYVMVFAGTIYGLTLAMWKKQFKGLKLPFVPFMVLGYLAALVFGQQIITTYLNWLG